MLRSTFSGRAMAFGSTIWLAATATPGLAQEAGPYASIGLAHATSNADRVENVSENSGHLQLRGGYALNRYLAVEVEGSVALVKSDFDDVDGPGGRVTLDRYVAGFAVAKLPVSDDLSLHARGGYYASSVNLRTPTLDQSASFDDFAFGAGASYRWGDNAIRGDFTVLQSTFPNDTAASLDHRLFSLSFVRSF